MLLTDGLLTRTATITTTVDTGTLDRHGNHTLATSSSTVKCELQQDSRDESTVAGTVATSQWVLILPPNVVLNPGDRVEVDGQQYDVHGQPWAAHDPLTGQIDHVEATLVATQGARPGGGS